MLGHVGKCLIQFFHVIIRRRRMSCSKYIL